MTMAGLDGYGFVFRERALAAFRVLANHGLVGRQISQPPDFRDGDRRFVPLVFVAFDVHEELLAGVLRWSIFSLHFTYVQLLHSRNSRRDSRLLQVKNCLVSATPVATLNPCYR